MKVGSVIYSQITQDESLKGDKRLKQTVNVSIKFRCCLKSSGFFV